MIAIIIAWFLAVVIGTVVMSAWIRAGYEDTIRDLKAQLASSRYWVDTYRADADDKAKEIRLLKAENRAWKETDEQ